MVLHRSGSRTIRPGAAAKALVGACILSLCTSSALAHDWYTGVPVANLISESKHGVSGLSLVPSSPCSRSCQPSFRCSLAGFTAEAPSNWRWWPSGTSWPCFGANTPADPVSVLGIGFSGLCCTDSGRNASRSWCW
jgi:hypothetical protein